MSKCNCKWEPSWNLNVFHCGFRGIRTSDRYPVDFLVIWKWYRSTTDKFRIIKISKVVIMIMKSWGKFYAAQHTEPTQNNFVFYIQMQSRTSSNQALQLHLQNRRLLSVKQCKAFTGHRKLTTNMNSTESCSNNAFCRWRKQKIGECKIQEHFNFSVQHH